MTTDSAGPALTGPDRHHNVAVPRSEARTTAPWAVVVVLVPSLLCLAGSAWLDAHTDSDGPGIALAEGWGWPYALLGALISALAAVVLFRRPTQGFGWGLAFLGLFWATDGLAQSYVRFGIHDDHAEAGINFALWNLNRIGAFLIPAAALLLFLFPTGRFLPGRWRVVGWVSMVAMVVVNLVLVLSPARGLPDVALPPGVDMDYWALPLPAGFVDAAMPVTGATTIGGFLLAMVSVVVRYRRSAGLERDRMRWLLWSVVAMAILLGVSVGLELREVGDWVLFLVMALPAAAMTVAIVDPGLVSIEDLLGRTLVYGGLAAVILLADLAVLAALTTLLDDSLEQRQVVLVVLLVSVLLYGPLRTRLARWVQRLMLGRRSDPYDVVAGLASTLETTDEGPEQLAAVARAVATAFRVRYVGVEVDRANGERLLATHGEKPAQTRTTPIVYRGAEVGRLVLPARGPRSRLSRRDEQLLGDLVRQAATAARTSQLAGELQESRERLVAAREEERRRIRRDLHDGLGPALSGVVFRLESARLLVERDPATAVEQITRTSQEVQAVVADVRRLVHDLRPPALDDLGLVGALRQLAGQLERGGPRIGVVEEGVGALPAAVEVAVYRIVAEALTNAVRHARADRVDVRLTRAADGLRVEVVDDGVGMGEDVEAGVGLLSMRERAAELGGRVEVSCPASGGTVVRACLPVGGREEAGEPA